MKKESGFIFYGLFFLTAIIAEIYCLLEFRDDIITLAGVAIVVLIAAYLYMDSISEMNKKERERIDEKFKELEKLQKAIYVASKRSSREESKEETKRIIQTLKQLSDQLLDVQRKS